MQDTTDPNRPRRRLSDILNGGTDTLADQWTRTEAATDFAPLPAGTYTAHVVTGELHTAKSGTPGYKLTFRVLDGEHAGRQFWHDVWLTPAALPMAKRDLAKLGVTALEQLETPLPPGIRCRCKLALRRDDDGTEYNRLQSFGVLGIDDAPAADDDFAPGKTPTAEREADAPTEAPAASSAPPALIDTTPEPPSASALEGGR